MPATYFFNFITFLAIFFISITSCANNKASSSYVDDDGYCVVSINPSNPIKYIQQQAINVPDIQGHALRVNKSEQKITDTLLCNGDSLTSSEAYGMTDNIDHDGFGSGYVIFTTTKGDKIFLNVSGNSQKAVGEDLADTQSTGRIIGGTGNLAAAEGDYQYIGKFNRQKEVIQPVTNILRYKIAGKDFKKLDS